MSLEAIDAIKRAEEEARRIRTSANAEARRRISEAEAAGDAAVKKAAAKAKDELRELVARADDKARKEAEALAYITENKKAAIRARAEYRLDKAASLIVERIMDS